MREITDLILTMIVTLDEYGEKLNFTKSDIDNLIKEYDITKSPDCNERGWIILWRKGYVTMEQFIRYMDVVYEDQKYWIVFDSFDDILSKTDYSFEIDMLSGDYDWDPSDYYENDVDSYWYMYTEDTLNEIIEYCIKKEIEIEGELMTKENTKLKNGDIYFNDSKLVDLFDDYEDELEDLKDELNRAISDAQDSANQDEVYSSIVKRFEDKIGEFKRQDIGKTEKIFVNVNIDWNDIEVWLKEGYGDYEFQDESYGNLLYILKEMEYFDFDKPNYDYLYGDIDKYTLNEYTQDKLSW